MWKADRCVTLGVLGFKLPEVKFLLVRAAGEFSCLIRDPAKYSAFFTRLKLNCSFLVLGPVRIEFALSRPPACKGPIMRTIIVRAR